jgi:hypothetical protein
MFQKKNYKEYQNTFWAQLTFFLENRAAYEIMYKNIVNSGRPLMTICALHAG